MWFRDWRSGIAAVASGGAVMAGGALFTPEDDALILQLRAENPKGANWKQRAAKALGRRPDSIGNRYSIIAARQEKAETSDSKTAYTSKPLSLADVVELWKIDETVWEAVSFQPNKWEIGAKHPDTGKILTQPLYQTKVLFRRKKTASIELVAKQILADIEKAGKHTQRSAHVQKARKSAHDGLLLEIDVFDLHVGKMAWGAEAGADYDLKIAERIAKAAVADLLEQVGHRRSQISQVLLPFGNDFFQYDTPQGTTTAGTQVDHDGRFQKMFRVGHGIAWDEAEDAWASCEADVKYKKALVKMNPPRFAAEQFIPLQIESVAVHELIHGIIWPGYNEIANPQIPEEVRSYFEEIAADALAHALMMAKYKNAPEVVKLWQGYKVVRRKAVA
jgi:hypothetical protein